MNTRTRMSAIVATLGLVGSLALATASADESRTSGSAAQIALTEVARAQNPTAGAAGPQDTVWIAERAGTVRVLGDDGLGEPVLDISDETTTDGERGLLGLAFDERFAHLYLSYTDLEGTSTVDEFAVQDGTVREDTRRTVLTQEQPESNHNGGAITFGPDGYLYIALGDGGGGGDPQGNGQKLDTLLGKLLRIDPQGGDPYAIPEDNPFADDPDARGEIWSYGLRNPWRFSFDAGSGDLLIGDVGQSDWEEIDWAPASSPGGENYGWSQMEGTHPFRGGTEPANHVPPIHEYDRTGLGCSVTGGYVYRGEAVPGLAGQYVYSDYCDGTLRSLEIEDGRVTGEHDLGVNGGEVVSFAQDGDGELYVLAIGGTVSRVDPA
ncbi:MULTISPECIES: PQQ-dependent sugar dehydrogenase [Streptomyces]|uniref:PQQ-dependent sugar dehydrogenase n=1 Tax=Streptomyces violaceoruber TaxID=1935 RepID=A0ACD4X064_STRVN|nr:MULTISPECIES: PQQ-dependent sugar dehydrogenase [Streptomyces]MCW8121641.1 PQQ-dependent sugar dehydrogenase [Streptomyces anthocyanicus]MDX2924307.1 PQQ-dependent sugar dehydrogenase [Streptomyces sp. NRRL_B-16638]MDX3344279.1 PQQ-dependent sugar dehydrogenase [Streptomyces sp. ME02-6979A]MDX3399099.1 PQQ-dependent sugar dehydrogenase [Streptomyces sp. ME01-18h]MDX3406603.1 PQQ-dependent sugar dehydrogenase [Streptomyces sp. ME02-6977A]